MDWYWSASDDPETLHGWCRPGGEIVLPPTATRGMQLNDADSDLAILTCFEFDADEEHCGVCPTAEHANLIAAAPDLLAACERAVRLSDHADGCKSLVANISELRTPEQIEKNAAKCDCHLRDCKAAIAKAKGGAA